jgi:PTH2 family peptidyl-tRNA hydrolase
LSEFSFKQVIVVRSDLQMSRGKTAVQVAHAAVLAAEEAHKHRQQWWRGWLEEGQCKVALKVEGIEDLRRLREAAEKRGLPFALVEDRGLTEIPPGTTTCLGIGPAPSEAIDEITGDLPLL